MSGIAHQTLYCPFQSSISPYATTVDQHTLDWAYSFGLLPNHSAAQRFHAAHFGWLAGYFAPNASLESLQLLSDWNTWAILWDDVCDQPSFASDPSRLAEYHLAFLKVLRSNQPISSDSPMVRALWNLRQRLVHRASLHQFHQFIRHVNEFFAGCVWEATNRAHQRTIGLARYIPMRRLTSGMYTSLKIVEIIEQIALPSTIWSDPVIKRLRERATNAVCWANDIISLHQETQRGDVHNLITVLQHTYHTSLHQAVAQAVTLHDTEVEAFQLEAAAIPSFGAEIDAQIERYIRSLRSFMYGNLAWSAMTGRYGLAQEEQAYTRGEAHTPRQVPHERLIRVTRSLSNPV